MRRARRRRPVEMGVLLAILAGGCGRPTGDEVAVDLAELVPFAEVTPSELATAVRPVEGGFAIPPGARLDFHLELPEAARLVFRGGVSGEASPLAWSIRREGEPRSTELDLRPDRGSDALAAALAGAPGTPVRLTLRHEGGERAAVVRRLTVHGRRPVESPPTSRYPQVESVDGTRGVDPASPRPNVVVYLIDTLRADHLGCYGYERPTSPAIDRFASEATLYEDVVAQSSWTKSGVGSLLTGLWPVAHGANRRRDRLPDEASTLAEILRDAGYRTAAFVGNPVAGPDFGFDQGFDHFSLPDEPTAARLGREALEWIAAESGPFFVYVHTIEPHMPYRPPEPERSTWAPQVPERTRLGTRLAVEDFRSGTREPTAGEIADTIDLYDGEVAANDRAFGEFVEGLRARGRYRNSVLLLVSDHGEEFHEHGDWTHGKSLHDESIRVPLIVRWPGLPELAGRRVATPVAQVDVLPTLLARLGIEPPAPVDGRPLDDRDGGAPLYSYLALSGPRHLAIVDGRFKLTERHVAGRPVRRLYDRVTDPGELDDLADRLPIRAGLLAQRLRRWVAEHEPAWVADPVELTPELDDELRALGYL